MQKFKLYAEILAKDVPITPTPMVADGRFFNKGVRVEFCKDGKLKTMALIHKLYLITNLFVNLTYEVFSAFPAFFKCFRNSDLFVSQEEIYEHKIAEYV